MQTVLLARVACPRVHVSHAYRPTLSPAFVDQLAGVADADRESAVELIEDYGTHYVESAVLGRQVPYPITPFLFMYRYQKWNVDIVGIFPGRRAMENRHLKWSYFFSIRNS